LGGLGRGLALNVRGVIDMDKKCPLRMPLSVFCPYG
jgi:hypothetical protein